MSDRSFRILLWGLALTGLLLDQASKYGVFAYLYDAQTHQDRVYSVFKTDQGTGFHLRAQHAYNDDLTPKLDASGRHMLHVNQGALFGFGGGSKELANAAFALISLLAALAIIVWSMQKSTASDRWLCAALGLILAGTLGNFYDRVMFGGVRDFLHWNYAFDWPVFNVADCCLVCGACLLLLQAFVPPAERAADKEAAALASAGNKA